MKASGLKILMFVMAEVFKFGLRVLVMRAIGKITEHLEKAV